MRTIALIAVLAASVGAGCRRKPAPHAAAHDAGDLGTGDQFIIATPEVSDAPVPPRFAAPVPSTREEIDSEEVPPDPWLRARLAAGDADVQRRLLEALRAAAHDGPVSRELRSYYLYRVFDATPTTCAWARTSADAAELAAVRVVLFEWLSTCTDELSGEFLLSAGAATPVIDWAFVRLERHRVPFDERIVAAAAVVAWEGEPEVAREIGFVLADMGERVVPAIEEMTRGFTDPERRALITVGLLRSTAPAAQELGRRACHYLATEPMCKEPLEVGPVELLVDEAEPMLDPARSTFDMETDQFPNEHDALLAKLAALTPALGGAVFEERAPENDAGAYVLRGYLGGKRYQLPAKDLGEWYDLSAVLGLLNAMLIANRSDWRLLTVETGDQTATVAGRVPG